MGWSCSRAATNTLEQWDATCRKLTGSSNQYTGTDGRIYFYETSRIEHNDGAITGTVWRYTPDMQHVNKAGSFRIEPTGIVTRKPISFPTT